MRTKQFITYANAGEKDFDMPKSWKRILSLTLDGKDLSHEIIDDPKRGKIVRLTTPPESQAEIKAMVELRDTK